VIFLYTVPWPPGAQRERITSVGARPAAGERASETEEFLHTFQWK